MLLMTATPIPRTMALVQFGAMSQSRITDMPPGRQPIKTWVVEDREEARKEVHYLIAVVSFL
jgi:ATP-dependent DNA helicase RecG